jgi:hypothetical protein
MSVVVVVALLIVAKYGGFGMCPLLGKGDSKYRVLYVYLSSNHIILELVR